MRLPRLALLLNPALPAALITALATTLPAAAEEDCWGEKHSYKALCKADEEAHNGCRIRGSGKLLAFCVPKGASLPRTDGKGTLDKNGVWRRDMVVPDLDFMTYRFGRPGKVELEFPKLRAGSAARFRTATKLYPSGFRREILFRVGPWTYHYVCSWGLVRRDDLGGLRAPAVTNFLRVLKDGRAVATLRCDGNNQK